MSAYKEETDFFWGSNNANRGRTDILVYSFPYTAQEAFTEDYLVAMRDSVVRRNVPGSFPNSYMKTEKRFELSYEPITYRSGKLCLCPGIKKGELDPPDGGRLVYVAIRGLGLILSRI